MKRFLTVLLAALSIAPAAIAQTAPDLFTFEPKTPIRADEVNANFQLLRDHITAALGMSDLTGEDLEELAEVVEQLQALAASGDLDGTSLEFAWDGTRLGVRHEGDPEYSYTDVRGATGPQGDAGPGLEIAWDGTRLGVRVEGDETFAFVDLVGPQGPSGEVGDRGAQGLPGIAGADGRSLQFAWDGSQLGVRVEGDAAYDFVDLIGPQGAQGPGGPQGEIGPIGPQGVAGEQGIVGPVGPAGPQGETGQAGATGETGPTGSEGPVGPKGPAGTDGRTLLDGSGPPSTATGSEGDFYIDTGAWSIYGPKSGGSWGAGTSLVGPPGPAGGGSSGARIVTSHHTMAIGTWDETSDYLAQCQPGEILVDVNVSAASEVYIYGWLAGIVPVSATEAIVVMARNAEPTPFVVHATCLGTAD